MTDNHAVNAEDYFTCMNFLNHEADLLDKNNLNEWFELLTEDIEYRIPIRTTRGRLEESEFSDDAFFMKEDHESLRSRIDRLQTEYDWSENPPSRSRRFVSNIKIDHMDEKEIALRSNLLLYRTRSDKTSYDLLSCEREDRLRWVEEELKLAKRRALLDQTVLGLESGRSLSVFL
jgi:3-phenylpropionate/cinnamic acid dioxygenase small subunit